MKASTLPLGSRHLGEGEPCLVVAHVGAAHEGSAETALGLIEAAFKSGADAIAFQVFRTDALLVRRHRERQEMEAVELSPRDWRRVLEAARGPQPLHSRIVRFRFSGHSHRRELIGLVDRLQPSRVILVHGDADARTWMANNIRFFHLDVEVVNPEIGEEIPLFDAVSRDA